MNKIEKTIDYHIKQQVSDMEAVEKLLGLKGRFVGQMVHISISDLAEIARKQAGIAQKVEGLVEALRIATEALEIGSDWGAPRYYDIDVPDGWEDAVDKDSEKPEWLCLYGIIKKCKQALAGLGKEG